MFALETLVGVSLMRGVGGEGYNTRCIDGCWGAAVFALETLVGVSLMRGVGGGRL